MIRARARGERFLCERSQDSLSVPELTLELGGGNILLRPANVLLENRAADDRWFHGRIGMESLRQARAVTIDFGAMTLRLDR